MVTQIDILKETDEISAQKGDQSQISILIGRWSISALFKIWYVKPPSSSSSPRKGVLFEKATIFLLKKKIYRTLFKNFRKILLMTIVKLFSLENVPRKPSKSVFAAFPRANHECCQYFIWLWVWAQAEDHITAAPGEKAESKLKTLSPVGFGLSKPFIRNS